MHVKQKPMGVSEFLFKHKYFTLLTLFYFSREKFTPQKHSLFFLMRRDQNHFFKNHENVWTDLKKLSGQALTENSNSFGWLIKIQWAANELGNPIAKKNQTENRAENQSRNAACEQKSSSEKRKFDSHKN